MGGLHVRVSFLEKLPPAFLSGCGVSLSLPTIAQDPSPESSPARGTSPVPYCAPGLGLGEDGYLVGGQDRAGSTGFPALAMWAWRH